MKLSFRDFVRLFEANIPPVPQGVDPMYWEKDWFRNDWLSKHPEYQQQQPTTAPIQNAPQARLVGSRPATFGAKQPAAKVLTPTAQQQQQPDTRYTKVPQDVYDKWKFEYDKLPANISQWFNDQRFKWQLIGKNYRWVPPPSAGLRL